MRLVRSNISSLLMLLFVASACATFTFGKTLIMTGETLDATGKTFVRVAGVYKQGCDVAVPRTIQQPQCAKFKAFGAHFQKSFPLTVQLWEAARAANDKAMQDKVEEVIVDLTTALTEFAVQVIPLSK